MNTTFVLVDQPLDIGPVIAQKTVAICETTKQIIESEPFARILDIGLEVRKKTDPTIGDVAQTRDSILKALLAHPNTTIN